MELAVGMETEPLVEPDVELPVELPDGLVVEPGLEGEDGVFVDDPVELGGAAAIVEDARS